MQPTVILQPTDDEKLQVFVDGQKKGFVSYAMVNNSPFGKHTLTLNVSNPETQREEIIVIPYIIHQ